MTTTTTTVQHPDIKTLSNGQKILMTANRQWMSRPDDERFTTLEELKAAVDGRKEDSYTHNVRVDSIRHEASADGQTLHTVIDGTAYNPTNWGFRQVCDLAKAPSAFMQRLSPELAANCLNEQIKKLAGDREVKLLAQLPSKGTRGGLETLRAATGPDYGRIWDAEVVKHAEEIVDLSGGRMHNPKDWSGKPSGLYASDRDVFIFLVDGGSMVDGGGERDQLHRGVILSNSEVGRCTYVRQTFLFRQVCGNHIIWGLDRFSEVRIRHTGKAPARFIAEQMADIRSYINASTEATRQGILRAKAITVPAKIDELLASKFASNFTDTEIRSAVTAAEKEEGKCENLWELVQGLTAHARENVWLETRVDLERRAGKMLTAALK